MNSFIRERLYYEIAMAIGNSLELEPMLKEGLSTYLRKLNCLAGAVFMREEDEAGFFSFRLSYAIPRRMNRNSAVREGIKRLPQCLDEAELADFMTTLPSVTIVERFNHYLMELPGFGLLLLVKNAPGLSRPDLQSLAPLNVKLAGACASCVANQRLSKEILERHKAEDKYRSIFNNAVEGIFQSSLDGHFLEVNPALARLLGYDSPQEVLDDLHNLSKQLYVHTDDRLRFLSRLRSKGTVNFFEFEYRRRDGSVGWASLSARLIRGADGSPTHIEGSADDITPRKQAVTALREARNEALHLSQMKSNFLSMVSHELRTPLTAILGFAKIARKKLSEVTESRGLCPPEVADILTRVEHNNGIIVAEGERLTELINNVLDLARLEAGRFKWDMNVVSVNEVLEHSLATSGVLFKNGDVVLRHAVQDNLPSVVGDHDRLIQVVMNLLSNAVKFTEQGEVVLSARVRSGEIVISVADTGVGVPQKERNIIFDKFRQLGDTLTDKPRGSGLGLPICKEIVEHHGGRLWMEDGESGGSVFSFSLPT